MRIGIRIPSAGPLAGPEALAAVASAAEELGYDSVWVTEHFALPDEYAASYSYTPTGKSWWTADSPHLEVFNTLSWVAARTERVRLGTSVVVLPFRNPVVLAKSVATLDVLSGGRAILGVGVGWLEPEFAALAVPMGERAARTNECLGAIRALLSQERPAFEGERHRFDGAFGFAPKPVQRPWPPIWVGGESRAALERVVRYGDGWHPGALTPEALAPKLVLLDHICAERGRDRSEIEISLRALPAMPWEDSYLEAYRELGVSLVIFDPAYTHTELGDYLREVEAYARFVAA
jgi:probable F420-dependent oxidoreductase